MNPALIHALLAGAVGFTVGAYIILLLSYWRHRKILHEHTMSLMATAANFKMLVTALESLASKGLPEDVRVKFDIKSDMN
jgi:uncharacterized membrane protein